MKSFINMKTRKALTAILLFIASGGFLSAQEKASEFKLTLKEAQDYAVQNNKMMISSRMDVEASRVAIWETISNLLPSISGTGNLVDNLKLGSSIVDFGGQEVVLTFGTKFNSSAAINANLLLFNAPLYVGLETTKLAKRLNEKNLIKTELDTRESVGTAYALILVSERSLEIVNKNIVNLQEVLTATKSMLSVGMAEQTDVDQMASNVKTVENAQSSLQRTIEVNYNLLRLELGLSPNTKIIISQDLESLTNEINVESLLSQEFDYKQNINYSLLEDQERLSALTLKSEKASILPTLASFYNYNVNGMGKSISGQRWFQSSSIGLSVSVPIFASGQRYSAIKKAQINLNKAANTKDMVTEQLLLQEKQLRYNLVNANLQYKSQKENVEVSKRVYTSTENKYKQGMASSLELTQANTLYLQAENNYVSALMNLLQTKLALDKLLNNM
jgi:outer membrane protein TolC